MIFRTDQYNQILKLDPKRTPITLSKLILCLVFIRNFLSYKTTKTLLNKIKLLKLPEYPAKSSRSKINIDFFIYFLELELFACAVSWRKNNEPFVVI